MNHLLATKAIKESRESYGPRGFMGLASMASQEVTSNSLTTFKRHLLCVPSMDTALCLSVIRWTSSPMLALVYISNVPHGLMS